ncbi:MAG: hypothetical protein Q4F21_14355 [Lachnospiraceae bacterium]|nr:hypothetical protein [Lachnospiraceae bacterium]
MKQVDIFLYISSKAPRLNGAKYIYVLTCRGKHVSGKGEIKEKTTGHRLVMTCAVEALKHMNLPSMITIHTNSRYLMNGHGYLASWKENGWKRAGGKNVKNADLWQQIYDLQKAHAVKYKYQTNLDVFG